MGLMQRFISFMGGTTDFDLGDPPRLETRGSSGADLRRNKRHSTEATRIAWVMLPNGTRLNVKNISYGGMGLIGELPFMSPIVDDNGTIHIELHVYHLKIALPISPIHFRNGVTGCSFVHSDDEGLKFLRGVLEFIRLGHTLREFSRDEIDLNNRGAAQHLFRGDLGTSLMVTHNISGSVELMELHFRDGLIMNQVVYKNGHLSYQRFGDRNENNFLALEQGFFTLIGMLEATPSKGLAVVAEAFKENIDAARPV